MPSFIGGVQEGSIVKTDGAATVVDSRSVNFSLLMRLHGDVFPDREICLAGHRSLTHNFPNGKGEKP